MRSLAAARSPRSRGSGAAASLAGATVLVLAVACAADPEYTEETFAELRHRLVEGLSVRIDSEVVLAAMRKVPRHEFVPRAHWDEAYDDHPLPIGHGQTISQPTIVALMTDLLQLTSESKVLEIGTGSGYQAAVLAEVAGEVYSIEILKPVAEFGAENLKRAGYEKVHLKVGDGYRGWPDAAPFDGIIVTCAPDHVPRPLQDQLAEGGRLVIPVGPAGNQELVLVEKVGGRLVRQEVIPVRFVPMTGEARGDAFPRAPVKAEGLN